MCSIFRFSFYGVSLLIAATALQAEVTPSTMFGDHMVLQREMPVPVWGKAAPGEKVVVRFAGQKKSTTTDQNGDWSVSLDALKASSEGRLFTIQGENKITYKDVLVGEVWICSGQSNMQFGWGKVPELKKLVGEAQKRNIRSYSVPTFVALTPQENCQGKWSVELSRSAVAFGFSYYLNQAIDIPVAVITTCWGSSSIEGWMPLELTKKLPHYKKIMKDFSVKNKSKVTELIKKGKDSGKDAKGWTKKENIFVRQQPNILYNAMMHPLAPYACRGLVWYQGEANRKRPEEYAKSLPVWINYLREIWHRDDFHVLVVMLPGFGKDDGRPDNRSLAWFREVQLSVLQLPHTGVVNSIDLGKANNIHPTDKAPICKRLALLARRDVLGEAISAQGPVYKNFAVVNGVMTITFTHAKGLKTKDGLAPTGFWLADKEGGWHPAQASIEGESIALKSDAVKKPVACRYAFCGKPVVNLVNAQGLPVYPFRTDTWSK